MGAICKRKVILKIWQKILIFRGLVRYWDLKRRVKWLLVNKTVKILMRRINSSYNKNKKSMMKIPILIAINKVKIHKTIPLFSIQYLTWVLITRLRILSLTIIIIRMPMELSSKLVVVNLILAPKKAWWKLLFSLSKVWRPLVKKMGYSNLNRSYNSNKVLLA